MRVEVRAARPLPQALEENLTARLQELCGEEVALAIQVEPALEAGLELKIGDRVIRGSARGYLEALFQRLEDISVPTPEGPFVDGLQQMLARLREEIAKYEPSPLVDDEGTVLTVGDGIARISGLTQVELGELLEFSNGVRGMALNLEENNVGAILLGPEEGIREGDLVKRSGRIVEVPVGDVLLGRVVNPLGEPLDGGEPIHARSFRPVEAPAPGIAAREPVRQPLQTGIKAIDSLIPIGRGQRELIIGDRQTGKTAIALDTIINQRGQDVICIYVSIGQKTSTLAQVVSTLEEFGAMPYTIVVAASASDTNALQYLAPYAGCAMAEDFMYRGRHVLIVYDDLSKHAVAYRAISLLLRRPPGREAFPGDIFYLHARLLERAAKLNQEHGGGSMTALPIVETQAGDVSAYIPTNVISITDGQIFLSSDLFFAGVRPAVNAGLSVSRVGGDAQIPAVKRWAGRLRLDLAQYRELAAFAQFGAELDKETQAVLARGERVVEILKQPQFSPLPVEEQAILLYATVNNYLAEIPVAMVREYEKEFLAFMREHHPEIGQEIRESGELDERSLETLDRALAEFRRLFQPRLEEATKTVGKAEAKDGNHQRHPAANQ